MQNLLLSGTIVTDLLLIVFDGIAVNITASKIITVTNSTTFVTSKGSSIEVCLQGHSFFGTFGLAVSYLKIQNLK